MQTTTRKSFLLPELTDDNPTPGAVIRESFRSNATLSDKSTFYDADETVTGKWTYNEAIVTGRGIGTLMLNSSGGARAIGDVVMMNPAIDSSIILPSAAAAPGAKIGIVTEAIAAGAVGRVVFQGFARVKVAGGVGRGQYLYTQSGSAIAAGSTVSTGGAFAMAATNADGSSTVLALLGQTGFDTTSNAVEVRAGATAQTLRVYNTYTDDSNYERLSLTWSANVATLATEQAGTGTPRQLTVGPAGAAALAFQTGGTSRWNISSAGNLLATADNTYDIGASGATRPRTLYVGTNVNIAGKMAVGALVSANAAVVITGSVTAASGTASGISFSPTLIAAANSDALVGLNIQPAFTPGAFTSLQRYAIYVSSAANSIDATDTRSTVGLTQLARFINTGASPTSTPQLVVEVRRAGSDAQSVGYRIAGVTYGSASGWDIMMPSGLGSLQFWRFGAVGFHIHMDSGTGTTIVRGQTNDSTANTLQVQNLAGTQDNLVVRNDGYVTVAQGLAQFNPLSGASTLFVVQGNPATSTTLTYGIQCMPTFRGTAQQIGLYVRSDLASVTNTGGVYGVYIASPGKTSASVVTQYGLYVEGMVGQSGISWGVYNLSAAMVCGAGYGLAFFSGAGAAQGTVTGSRAGNAALASLLTALANYGLIVNSSTA